MRGISRWMIAAAVGLLTVLHSVDAEPERPKLQLPKEPKPGQVFVNPVDGSEMVFVPGGTFRMGGVGKHDGKPEHEVQVAGFWLGKYEVTNEQYEKFLKATGHVGRLDRAREALRDSERFGQAKQPVVALTWDDAVA